MGWRGGWVRSRTLERSEHGLSDVVTREEEFARVGARFCTYFSFNVACCDLNRLHHITDSLLRCCKVVSALWQSTACR